MSNLTSNQAAELAKNFLVLAQSIGNYRFSNWKKLTPEENKELSDQQWSILEAGENILAESTALLINEAASSIKKIQEVTVEIDNTILKIRKVQQVIDISAAIIALAAVIIGKQPLAIPGAINNLIKAVKP
ncbi:MAG: hypothetical protein EOO04_04625 [Chitinophagaceae bacterium]|nr:MAG: hypothetical protein EOO04_04625 [Chitinophagaceae bacterium]